MPYLVDTGGPYLAETDDLNHAYALARGALEAADDFAARQGWAPFWADTVAVLRCTKAQRDEWHGGLLEAPSEARLHASAAQVRKRLKMPPCPAPRP
jgi:hypothetical protein